jgi:hypothetical protein
MRSASSGGMKRVSLASCRPWLREPPGFIRMSVPKAMLTPSARPSSKARTVPLATSSAFCCWTALLRGLESSSCRKGWIDHQAPSSRIMRIVALSASCPCSIDLTPALSARWMPSGV